MRAASFTMRGTRTILHSFAQLLQERHKWDDCFAQYRLIADACRNPSIDCGQWRGWHLNGFADALLEAELYDDAVKVATESVEFCSKTFAPGDWRTADAKSRLGLALSQTGDSTQAEALLTEAYLIIAAAPPASAANKRQAYERLRQGLAKIGRTDRLTEFAPPSPPLESR